MFLRFSLLTKDSAFTQCIQASVDLKHLIFWSNYASEKHINPDKTKNISGINEEVFCIIYTQNNSLNLAFSKVA